MSRREAKGLLFARIERSIRNFSSPFARGNGQFAHGEDMSKSLLHSVQADFLKTTTKKSPVVEGISRAWRLREENLCASSDGIDIRPIEVEDADLIGICAEPVTLSCRRLTAKEVDMFEFGHGTWHGRNGGRKPRRSTRETIRHTRNLSHVERMIAGEILRSDGEERRNRRRARACKRPIAEVLEFPTRTSQSADESAAA